MKHLNIRPLLILIVSASIGFIITNSKPAFATNRALVIGVGKYPHLDADDQLNGPTADVAAFTAKLRTFGYQVTTLTNNAATRQGILNALSKFRHMSKSGDRFVFYFAGHGTKTLDDSGAIVTSDAAFNDQTHLIKRDDLYQVISAIPASARTVLLDSCFSGALTRGLHPSIGHKLKARYVRLFGAKSLKIIDLPNGNDTNTIISSGSNVCYFTATNNYEPAYEGDFHGITAGVFTHFLIKELNSKDQLWNDVQRRVSSQVKNWTDSLQEPTLSAGFVNISVFNGIGAPFPPMPLHQVVKTVWDEFSESNINADVLRLNVTPNRTEITTADMFHFKVDIGFDGYIVIMERDTNGNLKLVYPTKRSVDEAKVVAGDSVLYPSDLQAGQFDSVGIESIKAILIPGQDEAAKLLAAFPDSDHLFNQQTARKSQFMITTNGQAGYFTSSLTFSVVKPSLVNNVP